MIGKSQPTPDVWLLNQARDIFRKHDKPERARTQTSVTLRRRFRGTGKSDRFGLFDAVSGDWLGDLPAQQLMMDLYSLNIVKAIILANQAAMVQARVEVTVEAASKAKEGVAEVGDGLYKCFNNHPDYWSNNLENQANQQMQTDYGCWLHTYHDHDADSLITTKIDEYSDEPLEEPGEYACRCGAGGKLFSDMMGQATESQVPCPSCNGMAEIIEFPNNDATSPVFRRTAEYPSGNTVMEVVSDKEIRVDERRTKSGNIRKARYIDYHFLMDEEDLQAMVPYFEIQTAQEWSYPIKWQYCLETGNDLYMKPWSSNVTDEYGSQPHEVRKIYVRPALYRHYRSPTDFQLDRGDGRVALNRKGEPMLELKAGEGFIKQYPNGFFFLIDNDRLLPYIEAADLRDEWAYLGFVNDSASTYYQPCAELNELQRATNNLYTIDVQQRESASINTRVYDSEYFEADDLEQQLAPTSSRIENGDDIMKHVGMVPGVPSSAPMEGMNFIRAIVGDISGVQPAMQGRPQPGVAYAAQAQQREQSLGRLIPSQYSKAEAKACSFVQFMKHAQRNWPRERFEYIKTRYGEKWKDSDIDDFIDANLELDLEVKYKEDSVVPASLIQQQLAFQQVITIVANAAKATGNAKLLSLDLLNKYVQKMVPGEGIDIENVDRDERLADSRYRKIVSRLKEEIGTGLPFERAIAQAMSGADLKPLPREVHSTHIEWYMDQARALMAVDHPNYPLLTCIVEMMKRHEKAQVVEVQTETADELEGHAPVAAVQKAMADSQSAAAGQAEAAKAQSMAQAAAIKSQADAQVKELEFRHKEQLEAQRQQFELEKQRRDLMSEEQAREDDAQRAEAEFALRAAELAKPEGGGSGDMNREDKVSVNYKDLAIPGKRDVLRDRGLSTGGLKDTQVPKPAAKPPAKASPRPLA